MTDLNVLFNPRGIAVVGASPNLAQGGGQALHALIERGYPGSIFPVNPRYPAIGVLKTYGSILDIPGPCDVAIIALPAAAVPKVVADCGAAGIRFAVIHSSGFREAGVCGTTLEHELMDSARAACVRIVGPNCLGVINVPNKVYAAFGSMIRAPFMLPGKVALVSQSGAFGHSMALYCQQAGVGFRYLMAIGNESDVTTADVLDFYLDDPDIEVIIAYVEGIRDGRRLMALGHKAARLGKPILLWKGGQSEQGIHAVASHTANMAGRYDIFRAALEQSGIVELTELEDVPALIRALSSGRVPRGSRFAVLGGSGGSAIVFVDAAARAGLTVPTLGESTTETIRSCVPAAGSADNPIDFTASFLNDTTTEHFRRAVECLASDDSIDQLLIILSTVQGKRALNGARILAEVSALSDKPIFVFSSVPREFMAEAMDELERARIPVLRSPARIARIAGIIVRYARHAARLRALPALLPAGQTLPRPRHATTTLDERESKRLLAQHGIPVLEDTFVPKAEGGSASSASLSYPVAVKIVSRDLPHKSDIGGVALGIRNAEELVLAIHRIERAVDQKAPQARIAGFIVSPMVQHAIETILGIINDEIFGPVILFGLGGTLAEVSRDVSFRVAPFDEDTAYEMVRTLRASALFDGVRGAPCSDIPALCQVISRLSEVAWALRDSIVELDINPLFVRGVGHGVAAADALAVVVRDDRV